MDPKEFHKHASDFIEAAGRTNRHSMTRGFDANSYDKFVETNTVFFTSKMKNVQKPVYDNSEALYIFASKLPTSEEASSQNYNYDELCYVLMDEDANPPEWVEDIQFSGFEHRVTDEEEFDGLIDVIFRDIEEKPVDDSERQRLVTIFYKGKSVVMLPNDVAVGQRVIHLVR